MKSTKKYQLDVTQQITKCATAYIEVDEDIVLNDELASNFLWHNKNSIDFNEQNEEPIEVSYWPYEPHQWDNQNNPEKLDLFYRINMSGELIVKNEATRKKENGQLSLPFKG